MPHQSFQTIFLSNYRRRGGWREQGGKRLGLGLKPFILYLGMPQTAANTISKWDLVDGPTLFEQQEQPSRPTIPHYLLATTEPGTHLTMEARINSLVATTFVGSSATGVFINQDFAQNCGVEVQPKLTPREVWVIDSRVINSGLITHEAIFELIVGSHCEIMVADLTNTGRYHCILEILWLVRHDPTICWSQNHVIFYSVYCHQHCLQQTITESRATVGEPKKSQGNSLFQDMGGSYIHPGSMVGSNLTVPAEKKEVYCRPSRRETHT